MHRIHSKVVVPNVNETALPAGLSRSVSGLAPWAWPRQISYRLLILLFTITYLFVSHAQSDGDIAYSVQTDRQTDKMSVLHQ